MSGIDMAENRVSIMDGKLEKDFQNAEKENKELKLSYFTDSKMSIFAHVYNSEIRLRLTIGGILQLVASYNHSGPGGCPGEVVKSWVWPNVVSVVHVVSTLIDLCTLL